MSVTYEPNDPNLPLILPRSALHSEIYQPVCSLVDYVNSLFEEGFSPDTVLRDFVDLYYLDFYDAQVRNGGHSQFIHNSFDNLFSNLERAERAAKMIGFPKLANLVHRCHTFCINNPEETAEQNGFSQRAAELDDLDNELYKFEYTPEERALAFKSLPPDKAEIFLSKFTFDRLEETAESVKKAALLLIKTKTPEEAANDAVKLAKSLIEQRESKRLDPSSEYFEGAVARQTKRLTRKIRSALDSLQKGEEAPDIASKVIEHISDAELYDLSPYHIHSAIWIAGHSNLKLVSSEDWMQEISAVANSTTFANQEQTARKLYKLNQVVLKHRHYAIAETLGKLATQSTVSPLYKTTIDIIKINDRLNDVKVIEIVPDGILLLHETRGVVSVYTAQLNPLYQLRSKFSNFLKRLKLISSEREQQLLAQTSMVVPGKKLAFGMATSGIPELLYDLHLPEALLLWSPELEGLDTFHEGNLEDFDFSTKSFVWRFLSKDEIIIVEGNRQEVRIFNEKNEQEAIYPTSRLRETRQEYSKMLKRFGSL
ncbi:DUF4375 domain-containing protein [Pseudovibrio denitrificans]|uniref:DMP19 family protein n=1 Tax=Pseudovibrio denitrificans TaxID=258256 RepID=UPI0039BF9839